MISKILQGICLEENCQKLFPIYLQILCTFLKYKCILTKKDAGGYTSFLLIYSFSERSVFVNAIILIQHASVHFPWKFALERFDIGALQFKCSNIH